MRSVCVGWSLALRRVLLLPRAEQMLTNVDRLVVDDWRLISSSLLLSLSVLSVGQYGIHRSYGFFQRFSVLTGPLAWVFRFSAEGARTASVLVRIYFSIGVSSGSQVGCSKLCTRVLLWFVSILLYRKYLVAG